jgi:cytidylate kinase
MTLRVVAVDGPAAAGKGTLARRLAGALGLPYLDTGLLYRAVGRRVLDRGADPHDAAIAVREAQALTAADLDRGDLRGPGADMAASTVAAIPRCARRCSTGSAISAGGTAR